MASVKREGNRKRLFVLISGFKLLTVNGMTSKTILFYLTTMGTKGLQKHHRSFICLIEKSLCPLW